MTLDLREAVVLSVGAGAGPKTFTAIVDGKPEIILAPPKDAPAKDDRVVLRLVGAEWTYAGRPQ
jgi:hypothetical protein